MSKRNKFTLSDISQSIEKEFIETYRKLPMLWDTTHVHYTNKFKRLVGYNILVKILRKWIPGATEFHVRQKINILRSCYRKDLRRHLSSETLMPNGEISYSYMPTSWKFHALRFLEKSSKEGYDNTGIIEIKTEEDNFKLERQSDEYDSNIEDNLTVGANETLNMCDESKDVHYEHITIHKRAKSESIEDKLINYEFRAVGNNVACKLKQMDPQQRYHAELLINKVIINGLMNKLTDNTELTEVFMA